MHDTLIQNVKLHVDSVNEENGELNLIGWCASDSVKIENVRLSKGEESFNGVYGKERQDVQVHGRGV